MKWILYSLLLANLAYLGFHLLYESPAAPTVTGSLKRGPATLQLLSERRGGSDRQMQQQNVLENPVVLSENRETDRQSALCVGLGPFADLLAATDVAERLNGIDIAAGVTAVDTPGGDYDYRVVLPPLPSLQEAFRRLRELKSRNIDSYVITDGKDAQGISLGVFSTREAADDHRQTLQGDGYVAVIREIPQVIREFWVVAAPGEEIPEYQVSAVSVEFSRVSLTETDCMN